MALFRFLAREHGIVLKLGPATRFSSAKSRGSNAPLYPVLVKRDHHWKPSISGGISLFGEPASNGSQIAPDLGRMRDDRVRSL